MKINNRLLKIAAISLAAAIGVSILAFNMMKKAAEPEATTLIVYFRSSLQKDTIVTASDFVIIPTPVSLVPKTAVQNTGELVGKKLVNDVETGEFALPSKLIERGDVRVDVKDLWTIGLDVENISSFLGGNLKEGKEYVLLHRSVSGSIAKVCKGMVSSLLDGTGKLITSTGDGVVKTVNFSVPDEQILITIAQAKASGKFELVDAPEGYVLVPEKPELEMIEAEMLEMEGTMSDE